MIWFLIPYIALFDYADTACLHEVAALPNIFLKVHRFVRNRGHSLISPGEVAQVTADAAEYFRLPRDRTVIMGSRIEL
jgi:hypothetical protein